MYFTRFRSCMSVVKSCVFASCALRRRANHRADLLSNIQVRYIVGTPVCRHSSDNLVNGIGYSYPIRTGSGLQARVRPNVQCVQRCNCMMSCCLAGVLPDRKLGVCFHACIRIHTGLYVSLLLVRGGVDY